MELICVIGLSHWLTELITADPGHLDPVHQLILVCCVMVLGSAVVVVGMFCSTTITFATGELLVQIKKAFVRPSLSVSNDVSRPMVGLDVML